MSSYGRYKKWWIKHQAPHEIPSLYYGDTPESAFKQHIKDMGLYKLMETLESWEEGEVPSFPRVDYGIMAPSNPYNKPIPTTWQKPQCQKCGMYLDKVMGYVCGDNHCPTFMKVTC